jgi:hypothetical protein
MRGTGEGHYGWDLGESSTMTNGSIGTLTGATGHTMTVTYNGGEKTVVVPDDVPVVDLRPGDRSLLKPGARAFGSVPRRLTARYQRYASTSGRTGSCRRCD